MHSDELAALVATQEAGWEAAIVDSRAFNFNAIAWKDGKNEFEREEITAGRAASRQLADALKAAVAENERWRKANEKLMALMDKTANATIATSFDDSYKALWGLSQEARELLLALATVTAADATAGSDGEREGGG